MIVVATKYVSNGMAAAAAVAAALCVDKGASKRSSLLLLSLYRCRFRWWSRRGSSLAATRPSALAPAPRTGRRSREVVPLQKFQGQDEELLGLDHYPKPYHWHTPELQVPQAQPASTWSVPDEGCNIQGEWVWESQRQRVVGRVCEQGQLSEREPVGALWGLVLPHPHSSCYSRLYSALRRCVADRDLVLGRCVHALAVRCGYESDTFLCNHIMRMYVAHARLQEAMDVFAALPQPDAFTWSAVIQAHVKQGRDKEALQLYHEMHRESRAEPDGHVFAAALQACTKGADLRTGQLVHAHVLASGLEPDVFVCSCLVSMYAKCGSLQDARRVFDGLDRERKNVVTWTSLMAGYVEQGMGEEALRLHTAMMQEQQAPNAATFVCLLQACAGVGAVALEKGKQLHAHIRHCGFQMDAFVGSSLVNMYAKCGSLEDARSVFDALSHKDVVTWTALIAGYSQQGMGQQALACYRAMLLQEEGGGITPGAAGGAGAVADRVTFVCLLQACASVGGALGLQQGKQLHSLVRDRGLEGDAPIGNSLVTMYAKCGSLASARKVFDTLPARDVVTWNAMISGYAQQGLGQEALTLYASMQRQEGNRSTPPNHVTFLGLLQACAGVGALQQGRQLHREIRDRGLHAHAFIGNSLLNMYAKCGSMEDARNLFDSLPARNVVTWNALLNGYAEHSDVDMAIRCFQHMLQEGVEPDETTFICLLVACSHAGLVHEGRRYFRMMEDYGIVPSDYPLSCMVDLLGRSGQLDEAEHLLRTSSFVNDVVGWTALLSACKSYGDVERGRRCFDHLVRFAPEDASPYVLLGSIYADVGRWVEVDRIESLRKSAGAVKKPAKACIEVRNEVHEFTVGEERADISPKLRSLSYRLKAEGGHVPQTHLVLKAVSEQEKEDALCGHAEKLALAYGLLHTPDGATLLVTKNLRMCDDCHRSTKIMSRLEKRDIVVRDAHRVHRFVDGSCSCGDRH